MTVHVTQGGGSFGRKLFHDAALEAAEISQKFDKPVKVMWHRTDDTRELVVDRIAARMGKDPYEFRREFFKDRRARAVLDEVARIGRWGREMPPGTAQGLGFHAECCGVNAVLVEIDCRPETTGRQIRDAVTGPRVTKAVSAVDVGLPVNPRGLEAQMMGCLMDGIARTLPSSLHVRDGRAAGRQLGRPLLHHLRGSSASTPESGMDILPLQR